MDSVNKYTDVLKQYNLHLNEQQIRNVTEKIISEKLAENKNKETLETLYSCIDLTSLHSTDTNDSIWKLTEKVNDFEGSSNIPNVAAICVFPNFVEIVKDTLTAQEVKIACVAGGFPHSQTFTEVKIAETALAVANGADEVDVVMNLGMFFSENYEELTLEIDELKHAAREAKLKVIIETGALQTLENIKKATLLSLYSGADFIKTSTGKGYPGANLEAAYVICSAIKEYYGKTGRKVGFKAAGGISTTEDAVKYFTIVKEVLGEEWCNKNYLRIGSSQLSDKLLENIGQ